MTKARALRFIREYLRQRLRKQYLRLVHFLARINTIVLLAIVYFVLITPLGLVLRMFRRLQYQHALRTERASLWVESEDRPSSDDLARPF